MLLIDELGYLTHGPDAANVLFHVVNERHQRRRPILVTTNKPLSEWGRVLHDPDLAEAIADRILERGRYLTLDGPSGRTRHLGDIGIDGRAHQDQSSARVSGKGLPELLEPTSEKALAAPQQLRLKVAR